MNCAGCNEVGYKWCTWRDPFSGVMLCQLCSEFLRGDAGEEWAKKISDKLNEAIRVGVRPK